MQSADGCWILGRSLAEPLEHGGKTRRRRTSLADANVVLHDVQVRRAVEPAGLLTDETKDESRDRRQSRRRAGLCKCGAITFVQPLMAIFNYSAAGRLFALRTASAAPF